MRPLIIVINVVMSEENRKGILKKKKKSNFKYVMSSVKFPLRLYNAVAIKEQFPVSEKEAAIHPMLSDVA